MIGIKIFGEFLELDPNTSLTLELKNPMFLDDKSNEVIPGSYSFPFKFQDTPKNSRILNHPSVIDNAKTFIKDEIAEIHFCGVFLWTGLLTIKKSSEKSYKAYFVLSQFSKLKGFKLNELELGTRTIGQEITQPSMVEHANDTALNPNDYDYVFYPIYNDCFFDDDKKPGTLSSEYQNFWDSDIQSFIESNDQLVAMPFIKVEYILEKIFERSGINLINEWQINDELRNLTVYNSYSIYNQSGQWSSTLDLKNHVSETPANEWFRELIRFFCLTVIPDYFSNTATLIPIKDLIKMPYRNDWTKKVLKSYEICEDRKYISSFCFSVCSEDKLDEDRVEIDLDEVVDFYNFGGMEDVTYYELLTNDYYNIVPGPVLFSRLDKGRGKPCYTIDNDGIPLELKMQPLYQGLHPGRDDPNGIFFLHVPEIGIKGTINYLADSDPNNIKQSNSFPDKLIFYRGMYVSNDVVNQLEFQYPHASNHKYSVFASIQGIQQVTGEYGLMWVGDCGVFNQWWKDFAFMGQKGRVIDRQICLTVKDLLSFSFGDKQRVENRDYFVKSLQITLTKKGIKPVQSKLVSIL